MGFPLTIRPLLNSASRFSRRTLSTLPDSVWATRRITYGTIDYQTRITYLVKGAYEGGESFEAKSYLHGEPIRFDSCIPPLDRSNLKKPILVSQERGGDHYFLPHAQDGLALKTDRLLIKQFEQMPQAEFCLSERNDPNDADYPLSLRVNFKIGLDTLNLMLVLEKWAFDPTGSSFESALQNYCSMDVHIYAMSRWGGGLCGEKILREYQLENALSNRENPQFQALFMPRDKSIRAIK